MNNNIKELFELIKNSKNLNVLTGAGISTLSGIPDFRGPKGVYNAKQLDEDVETILSIDYFNAHPDKFYKWASEVWYKLENYNPNIVHNTLATLEKKGYLKNIFTQNIDSLHEKAGSKKVYNLHGSAKDSFCTSCGRHYSYEYVAPIVVSGKVPRCSSCNCVIKPDITLYGEALNPLVLNRATECASHSDVFMVLGSSLVVQPAASLPLYAIQNGAKIVVVNSQPTYIDEYAYLKFNDLKNVFEKLNKFFN